MPPRSRYGTEERAQIVLEHLQRYEELADIFSYLERLASDQRTRISKGHILGARMRLRELGYEDA